MKSRFLVRCLAVLILVLATACTSSLRMRDYPRAGVVLHDDPRLQVTTHLRGEAHAFRELKLLSRCTLTHDEDQFASRYAFVARATGELRVEQFPTSGFYSIGALVSDTHETTVVFQTEKKALRMDPGAEGFSELFGIDFPLQEKNVGALLAGVLSLDLISQILEVRQNDSDAKWRIAAFASDFIALFDERMRLSEFHYFAPREGAELLALNFNYDDQIIPEKFTLKMIEEDVTLDCGASQRSYNQPVRDDVFKIDVPANFDVRDRRKS